MPGEVGRAGPVSRPERRSGAGDQADFFAGLLELFGDESFLDPFDEDLLSAFEPDLESDFD